MKQKYPRYKQGELQEIKKKLPLDSKILLDKFTKLCSVRAGEEKVKKIERHMIHVYDVTEKPLDKLTTENIIDFLIVLNKSDRSSETRNEIKVYLKKFLKWHYKDIDMIENISVLEKDKRKINDEKNIEDMLRKAERFRDRSLISLLWQTGARPQELLGLKFKDIKFKGETADITLHSNKTNRTRSFPVTEASKYLKEWKQAYTYPNVKPDDYIFPSPVDRSKPITSIAVNKMLRKLAKKSGVDKDIWSYLFRHTRATRLYETLPTPIVEKLMGHKDQYKIYAHISSKKARDVMMKKVYGIEEIDDKTKEKLEQEVDGLKIKVEKLMDVMGLKEGLEVVLENKPKPDKKK